MENVTVFEGPASDPLSVDVAKALLLHAFRSGIQSSRIESGQLVCGSRRRIRCNWCLLTFDSAKVSYCSLDLVISCFSPYS